MTEQSIVGPEVISHLALRFPQLYIKPSEGDETLQLHRLAAGRGLAPADANLAHFETSARDELRIVDTPAGPVEVVFLPVRRDCRPITNARTAASATHTLGLVTRT